METVAISEQEVTACLEMLSASASFRVWIREAYQKSILEPIVAGVMASGSVGSVAETLRYLAEIATPDPARLNVPRLTSEDLWAKRSEGRRIARLLQLISETPPTTLYSTTWRELGTLGHQAIPKLMTEELFSERRRMVEAIRRRQAQKVLFPELDSQKRLPLFDDMPNIPDVVCGELFSPRSLNRLLDEIEDLLITLMSVAEKSCDPLEFLEAYNEQQEEVALLRKALLRLFGAYTNAIPRAGNKHSIDVFELELLTLMSWAAATLYYRERGPQIWFREIPVFGPERNLSGGRVDALEVRRSNGKTLTRRMAKRLRCMSAHRFSSVGALQRELRELFGNEFETVVIDLKFVVGDGMPGFGEATNKSPLISLAEVTMEPLPKHRRQMERYLSFGSLDCHCANGGSLDSWPREPQLQSGELVYCMQTKPIVHSVALTRDEQERVFHEEVVRNWEPGQLRAVVRDTTNRILNHVITLLQNRKRTYETGQFWTSRKDARHIQQTLFSSHPTTHPLHELIEGKRRWADEHRTFEIVGENSERIFYRMHFDRLWDHVQIAGQPTRGDFEHRGRGWVLCSFHDDHDPSMHIDLGKQTFKCFSCGVGGTIASTSIPNTINISHRLKSQPLFQTSSAGTESDVCQPSYGQLGFMTPDEHVRIMALAQGLLHGAFKESQGEEYVRGPERKLNPDLAYSYGLGFGTDALINGLLDTGFTLDELIYYGFVGIHPNVSSDRGICPLLKHRGMGPKEMRRPAGKKKRKETWGFPYSVLNNRVTFPLEFKHINNFYGRSVNPGIDKRLKHRKLSVDHTKIPHGGFNMKVLDDPAYQEVIVVEGAFDTLALIEMKNPATMAMIGLDNVAIIDAIVRSGKTIAIALDNDEEGQKKTGTATDCCAGAQKNPSLMKRFWVRGARNLRNFTAEYVREHPDMTPEMDDWSTYFQKVVRGA